MQGFPESAKEPPRVLRGFERQLIKKGQSAKFSIGLRVKDISIWLVYLPGYRFHRWLRLIFIGTRQASHGSFQKGNSLSTSGHLPVSCTCRKPLLFKEGNSWSVRFICVVLNLWYSDTTNNCIPVLIIQLLILSGGAMLRVLPADQPVCVTDSTNIHNLLRNRYLERI